MNPQPERSRLVIPAAGALIVPPMLTFAISSMLLERGLDVFSVLLVEAVVFVFAAMAMRLRLWSAVLVSLLYVPLVFIFIFWIGYRAGFYDLP